MRSSMTGSSVWNLHRIPSISMASCIRFVCQIHGKETTVICSFYFCAVPKRWRNQAAAVERSRSTWRERALAEEAAAQGERAERIAIEAELQQVRGQSMEREAELAALRAQLVAPERAEKRGR